MKKYLTGKEANTIRSFLRKHVDSGALLVRQTYYDYYDSCHPPIETPDAEFVLNGSDGVRRFEKKDFTKGSGHGFSFALLEDGTIEGFTGYSTYQFKIKDSNILGLVTKGVLK